MELGLAVFISDLMETDLLIIILAIFIGWYFLERKDKKRKQLKYWQKEFKRVSQINFIKYIECSRCDIYSL